MTKQSLRWPLRILPNAVLVLLAAPLIIALCLYALPVVLLEYLFVRGGFTTVSKFLKSQA